MLRCNKRHNPDSSVMQFSLPKDCTQHTDILIQIFNEFAGKKNIEQAKIPLIYYLQTKPQQ